ncbi:MAG: hypothetical protein HQM13_01010 [SAR324 cluster bacterium]|nr:hypothetical protein [SAR324 cluster bacterium]
MDAELMEVEKISDHAILILPKTLEDVRPWMEEIIQLKSEGYRNFILNLSDKDWLASKEIATIMWTFKDLSASGQRLSLIVDSPTLLKTFQTTMLDKMVSIVESKDEALAELE